MEWPHQHMKTIETCCNKRSSWWASRFRLHNSHICHNSIHKLSSWFPSLFINNSCLALSFWLGLLYTLFFVTTLSFFMVTLYRSGVYHTTNSIDIEVYWCATLPLKQLTCLARSHAFYTFILHKSIGHWHSLSSTIINSCSYCSYILTNILIFKLNHSQIFT